MITYKKIDEDTVEITTTKKVVVKISSLEDTKSQILNEKNNISFLEIKKDYPDEVKAIIEQENANKVELVNRFDNEAIRISEEINNYKTLKVIDGDNIFNK